MRTQRSFVRRVRERGKPRAHVLHIGKTGGTAMKDVLAGERSPRYAVVLHRHAARLEHIPVGQKVVFVVRDPVARFISGFNSRLRQGGPAHALPWSAAEKQAYTRFSTPEELALALGSRDEREAADAHLAVRAVQHLRDPQIAWVGSLQALRARKQDVLLVGRQWALSEDFARLADLLGLATKELPQDEARSHRTPRGFDTRLSDKASAAVRLHYAADFALLGELEELGEDVGFMGSLPEGLRLRVPNQQA